MEIDSKGDLQPYITVNFATKDEVLLDRWVRFEASRVRYGRDICDVAIGRHFIRSNGGLNHYELFIDPEANGGYGLHLHLDRKVPSYSPDRMTAPIPMAPTSGGCARFPTVCSGAR